MLNTSSEAPRELVAPLPHTRNENPTSYAGYGGPGFKPLQWQLDGFVHGKCSLVFISWVMLVK